ncbi:unnamed protein product [Didymodactylos carnosus]|uniref:Uncharacterized protein n=1 Tax=Didymodactylos carnosus TaxID=1234261 RepID=A0A8S2GKQ8_9BILA|nr:unnamed protein product [Didymodactylos carnosus]CAF3527581.1 unnamed protein product [Didymodactylos carnosus]
MCSDVVAYLIILPLWPGYVGWGYSPLLFSKCYGFWINAPVAGKKESYRDLKGVSLDNWVKSVIYTSLAVPLFLPNWINYSLRKETFAIGVFLIVTGLLYFIKTFKYKQIGSDSINENDILVGGDGCRQSVSTQTLTAPATALQNHDNPSFISDVKSEHDQSTPSQTIQPNDANTSTVVNVQ